MNTRYDPWRFVEALVVRWHWVVVSAIGLGFLGFVFGFEATPYSATVKLVRNAAPNFTTYNFEGEVFKLREFAMPTLVDLMKSPSLLRSVANTARLQVSPEQMAARAGIEIVPQTELITLRLTGESPGQTVQLVNAYAQEAARLSRELQSNEVNRIAESLKGKLTALDTKLAAADRELAEFQRAAGTFDLDQETPARLQRRADLEMKSENLRLQMETVDLQITNLTREISRQTPALVNAQEALDRALIRYTEEHPKVKELRAALAAVESQIAARGPQLSTDSPAWSNSLASSLYMKVVELRAQRIGLAREWEQTMGEKQRLQEALGHLPEKRLEYAKIKSRYQSLMANRDLLANRLQEAQLVEANVTGYYRIFEPARSEDLNWSQKLRPAILWGSGTGLGGAWLAILLIFWVESADRRIRTQTDFTRVTRLPVIAALGDLNEMNEEARDQWAFRTLTRLKGTLKRSNTDALVCGFISSSPGEGRSTWIKLLADAARKQGYHVFTIMAEPQEANPPFDEQPLTADATLNNQSIGKPLEINLSLMSPPTQPVVRLPVPAWAWNLERREQWSAALQQWNVTDNLVVFVELPPASKAESVLLAEKVPQVIWLCGRDMARADETRDQLETLRLSHSNIAGGVFNRARTPRWKKRLGLAAGLVGTFLGLSLASLSAENSVPAPGSPISNPGSISVSSAGPEHLADWQKRLTLGPGDVLNISLYDQADSAKPGLFIGPDGRLTFLQAQDVMAAGLTVDELRAELEKILSRFYRSARVVVIPAAYSSKKYVLLGNVNQKGAYPLDRPTTLVEAIARARGFVTLPQRGNTLLMADLSRAFLIRKEGDGTFRQIDVDFEALFQQGDLRQNQALAPDDYLYFPPMDLQEIYVLGEVRLPGVTPYTPDMTALRSIVSRGGFTDKAFKSQVLIVRGSLRNPETHIVSVSKIYNAKQTDFPLKARDIVFVSKRPWSKVEELLEAAITDFGRSAMITWTGMTIKPIITHPFLK